MTVRDEFVLVKEAADMIGVCPNTIRSWGASGKLTQYRHPVHEVVCQGGSITDVGLYEVDKDSSGGLFTVKAEVDSLESIAEVRVVLHAEDGSEGDDDPKQGSKSIHWQGEVPPQKWMNFYTKVLSRFASTEGLKLKVSFEVPAEGEQGQAKAEEARSGLKELGLDDDVRLG